MNSDPNLHPGKIKTSLPLRTLTRGLRHDLRMFGIRTYLNMTPDNVVFVCLSVNEYLMVLRACFPPFARLASQDNFFIHPTAPPTHIFPYRHPAG